MTKPTPQEILNDPVLSYHWRRIYGKDQNVLMIICGPTGSCKSGSAITFGWVIDRGYNMEHRFNLDHVVFKADDFVKLVNSGLPKGSVIVWDEIGVENDSRNYYTLKNKLIKYVLQTFRYKNFMLIMTVPDLKSVDIGTRRLLHCFMAMYGPLKSRQMATGRIEFMQVNPKSGKEYFKMPRYFDTLGKRGINTYYIARPPRELENAYKKKKKMVTEQWYKDFDVQLSYMEGVLGEKKKEAKEFLSMKDGVEILLKKPLEVYDSVRKKFTGPLVRIGLEEQGYNVGINKSQTMAQMLNRHLEKGDIIV